MRIIATYLKFIMLPPSTTLKGRGWKFILAILFLIFLQSLSSAQPQPDDAALFREGEILLSKGESEKALWRFKRLTTEFPKSPLLNEAKFRMGICYTQMKRPRDAIRILNELLPTFLAPTRMAQIFTLLGDNYFELKDRLNALHWYGKAILVPGQPTDEPKNKVRALMDTSETEEELKSIESLYQGTYAGGYAKFKLAQLAKHQGNDALAKKILMELEKEYRNVDYGPVSKELSEWIPVSPKSKYTLGVILPLSGLHQPFGERVLQGIQLAIKEAEIPGKIPLISLAIRDSKGSPGEAEKAVEDLVNKEKAMAILGPLLSIEVDRTAKKAQQFKIPLLTLSQKELPAFKGEFVFQNSLIPSEQIQTLVEYTTQVVGLRTFAVFYPNSPYGLYFKNLFNQEITRKGGKVLGAVIYQEDQTDFTQEIKGFFKIESLQKYNARKKGEDEFKATLSIEGLFIPDTHDRVGTILSQMAFYDIKGLTFLGTSAWNGPGLISIAGKAAEGAIFVDAFFKKDPSPLVIRFVQEFQKTYQKDPEILEALGYDAAKLIKDILQVKLIPSPLQLKEEIQKIQNFQGVSGLKGFSEDGKAIRNLSILKVNNGRIELMSR